jgi:hypothetical protein
VYGQLHAARGERQRAREMYQAALVICDRLGEDLYRSHIARELAALTCWSAPHRLSAHHPAARPAESDRNASESDARSVETSAPALKRPQRALRLQRGRSDSLARLSQHKGLLGGMERKVGIRHGISYLRADESASA